MNEIYGFDAFSPSEIADRIENVGVKKANLPLLQMFMLGLLAGVFVGLGAMFNVIVLSDTNLSFAVSRVLGGLFFSMGLMMVLIAGAELFTGNNLLAMAWADGKISIKQVLRNWIVVCFANLIGGISLAVLVYLSGHTDMNHGAIATQYLNIASAKCSIPFREAFFSGILCNVLVCLAVWMAQAGRSVMDKVVVIILPVAAFVAAGFEHCVANMYYIPMGLLLKDSHADIMNVDAITWLGFFNNLIPVILGNLVGGSVLVSLVYYLIYRKGVH